MINYHKYKVGDFVDIWQKNNCILLEQFPKGIGDNEIPEYLAFDQIEQRKFYVWENHIIGLVEDKK